MVVQSRDIPHSLTLQWSHPNPSAQQARDTKWLLQAMVLHTVEPLLLKDTSEIRTPRLIRTLD